MDKLQETLSKIDRLPKEKQALLYKRLNGRKEDSNTTLKPVTDCEHFRASVGQRSLWLHHEMVGASSKYNMASAYRFEGELNASAFKSALLEVIKRHESLRTTFYKRDGELYQKVHPVMDIPVNILDLQSYEEAQQNEVVNSQIQLNTQFLFDLTNGPLIRAEILTGKGFSIFLLNIHHIVFDGVSKGIILKEVAQFYDQYCGNKQAPITAISDIQYKDFAEWQHRFVSYSKELDYWKSQLEGAPALLDLPLDYPRKPTQTIEGGVERVIIGQELTARLKEISQRNGCTQFMTMLAIYSLLLSKYSGQDDVVVGTPVDMRSEPGLERVVGYFLNTLALRSRPKGELSFEQYLLDVKKSCLEAYKNTNAPFDRVVQEINPQRTASFTPLFQAMMVFQNSSSHEFNLTDLDVTKISSGTNTTKYDLYLTFVELNGQFEGWLTYNSDLFKPTTIGRMLVDFQHLIEALCNNPDTKLAQLKAASQTGLETTLTTSPVKAGQSLLDQFKDLVTSNADGIALNENGSGTTYAGLWDSCSSIASALQAHSVAPGDLVAVHLARGENMIATMLACWKIGACFVLLDIDLPEEQLNSRLSRVNPVLLIGQGSGSPHSEHDIQAVTISDLLTHQPDTGRESGCFEPHPQHPAYLIFTSGSTGEPKAVLATHEGLSNRLNWGWNAFPYEESDICLSKTSPNFVDFVAEVFSPLLKGVPLVIWEQAKNFDLFQFVTCLKDESITRLLLVPSLLREMLEFFPDLNEALPDLKFVTVSGEELTLELTSRFFAAAPESRLLNLYGSSEVSADVSFYEVNADAIPEKSVPVGSAIENTQLYVLDEQLQPCPVGVKGTLYVSGSGLSLGYLNAPGYSARRFVPNPFTKDGQRMFNTGDLAKINEFGLIEYSGRRDRQVKLRGIRLDLSEIEQTIISTTQCHQAICSVIDINGEQHLCAHIEAGELAYIDSGQLRQTLLNKLPDFMVPTRYSILDKFPLLLNGKTDVASLPQPELTDSEEDFVAPTSELELRIAELWKSSLAIERVGLKDNFFDQGGHSLTATKLVVAIRSEFDIEVSARKIFELQTFENLAEHIEEKVELRDLLLQQEDVSEDESWETLEI